MLPFGTIDPVSLDSPESCKPDESASGYENRSTDECADDSSISSVSYDAEFESIDLPLCSARGECSQRESILDIPIVMVEAFWNKPLGYFAFLLLGLHGRRSVI